ncbi:MULTISPECIES: hypothetical protein [unclassified Sphingomonas]|uniref:hypothetical protein n=1 Tax=unclassified Sphingomonas TaxID=196159 RepID=UPI0006F559B1|nr:MULTISPECIES: hypothetical protein [unclassified Sphingomonas]KQX26044.1 hypothetical protein ASD17_00830 [Sphingomonas sp. Root1294]KQY69110.1 hypothetical protein ASD39_02025 [Sphingomonas sp. Root50]KRB89365.1 hypothetical protein ASE22_16940 [Sphingomonas sp. Root720]
MDDERARSREEERNRRAAERAEAAQARSERRAADRDEAARQREQARAARGAEDEARRAALAADREGRPKRRASGSLARTGEQKVVRDVRLYRTNVDTGRMRELAKRGATVEGLAKVFGVSIETVVEALKGDAALKA